MRVRSIVVTSLLVTTAGCTGRADLREPRERTAIPLEDVLVLGTRDGTVIVGSSS